MMSRPHGNTQTIQQRSEVEMMDISYQEGDDCSPFGCFTEYTHLGNSGKWVGFKARSVIGGYWMQVLMNKLSGSK